MVIYALLISMLLLLAFSYSFSHSFASPAVLFILPFCIAICNLIANIGRWNVLLNTNTYYVIISGTGCLIVGIFLGELYYAYTHHLKIRLTDSMNNVDIKQYYVSSVFKMFFLCFQVLVLVYCTYCISRVAGSFGYGGSLFDRIGGYKYLSTFTTNNMSLGRIGDILYAFTTAAAYILIYVFVRNLTATKKIDLLLGINLLVSIAICLSKGGRQSTIQLIFCGIIVYLILNKRTKGVSKFRNIIGIFFLGAILVISFQWVAGMLGTKSTMMFSHYIAIYLSAPIRNLDYWLQMIHNTPDLFGKMTFVRLYNGLGAKFGVNEWQYELDLPFLVANGYSAGNVYTTFYAYYYDFGYKGIPVLMIIMGFVSQLIYKNAKSNDSREINFAIILYSYIAYMLAFSFFSNKFYEGIVSLAFFYRLIYWGILIILFNKFRDINFKLSFKTG